MPETGNVVCVEDFFATIESYLNKEQVEFVRKAYDVLLRLMPASAASRASLISFIHLG